ADPRSPAGSRPRVRGPRDADRAAPPRAGGRRREPARRRGAARPPGDSARARRWARARAPAPAPGPPVPPPRWRAARSRRGGGRRRSPARARRPPPGARPPPRPVRKEEGPAERQAQAAAVRLVRERLAVVTRGGHVVALLLEQLPEARVVQPRAGPSGQRLPKPRRGRGEIA